MNSRQTKGVPTSFEGFSDWLGRRPAGWSVSIGVRAALRVIALAYNDADFAAVILPVFRATAIALYAAKYPHASVAKSANAASKGAEPILRAAVAAAASSADAVRYLAVAGGSKKAAAVASSYASDAILAARDCVGAYASADMEIFFRAIQSDARQLEEGRLSPEALAELGLWPSRPPRWITTAWDRLVGDLLATGDHWSVWIDWYRDITVGAPNSRTFKAWDAAFTDIPGDLPWAVGAEPVNSAILSRIQVLRPGPYPVEGVPSPVAIERMPDGRIGASAPKLSLPTVPPPLKLENHDRSLDICLVRAEQLIDASSKPDFQGRRDYRDALEAYLKWLPSKRAPGNMLLADGEARVLGKLFKADEAILPVGFATRLAVFLEDHIGLRAFYPEVEQHYIFVQTGRLVKPLERDVVSGIACAVRSNSPEVFNETVAPIIDETARPVPSADPPLPEDAPPSDLSQPKPPKDPISDVDPSLSREFTFASAANRIWEILMRGKDLPDALAGWQKAYDDFKPHIGALIEWLKAFIPSAGGGPPSPPPISI